MLNEIMKAQTQIKERDIQTVTSEIKELCRQAQNMALMYAIEIGRRLCEAKSVLHHGGWGEWLENEVNFSQSTANNFMKLFEEYGSEQITIFGPFSNSQTFGNLPYSKALQLLAIPSDEREEFAKEVDVENISVRKLKEAIKERNQAIEDAKKIKEREEVLERKFESARLVAAEAEKLSIEVENYKNTVAELEEKLKKAKEKETAAKEKLKKAESDPKIPPEVLNKIREEVTASVEDKVNSENEKQILEYKDKLAQIEKELQGAKENETKAREELLSAQNKIKTANPEVTKFAALFEEIQDIFRKLKAQVAVIEETDKETSVKLKKAICIFADSIKGECV
jgi:hypothetical protein